MLVDYLNDECKTLEELKEKVTEILSEVNSNNQELEFKIQYKDEGHHGTTSANRDNKFYPTAEIIAEMFEDVKHDLEAVRSDYTNIHTAIIKIKSKFSKENISESKNLLVTNIDSENIEEIANDFDNYLNSNSN